MADGGYRNLVSASHIFVDEASVTLATTMKALFPAARTITPANWWSVGKIRKLTAFGKATTDGTAGNYVFEMGYGAGDAPTPLVLGRTVAGTVSQTNVTWTAYGYAECRAIGSSGVLRMWGQWSPDVAILASTLSPYLFPATAPADVSIDTTSGANGLTFQLQRSGAGVWTAMTTGLIVEDLN